MVADVTLIVREKVPRRPTDAVVALVTASCLPMARTSAGDVVEATEIDLGKVAGRAIVTVVVTVAEIVRERVESLTTDATVDDVALMILPTERFRLATVFETTLMTTLYCLPAR